MTKHLNTNKQFMIGNGLLAFAVIVVVVIFVYMSMQMSQKKAGTAAKTYPETFTVILAKGFVGRSYTFYVNDSLLVNQQIEKEPYSMTVNRFADQSALMVVNNLNDRVQVFNLSEKGETISLVSTEEGVKRVEAD